MSIKAFSEPKIWQKLESERLKFLKDFTASFESEFQLIASQQSSAQSFKMDSIDVLVLLSSAFSEAHSGNIERARNLFRQTIEKSPSNIVALTGWATLEVQDRKPIAARDLFVRAARVTGRNRKTSEARKLYQQATESHPTAARSWVEWGQFEEWQRNLEQAGKYFREAAEVDPMCYRQWADFEARYTGPERACEILSNAHAAGKVTPEHVLVWAAWGRFEVRRGDYEGGERRLQETIASAYTGRNSTWIAESLTSYARAGWHRGARETGKRPKHLPF